MDKQISHRAGVEKRNKLRKQLENCRDEEAVVLKTKIALEEKVSRMEKDIAEARAIIDEEESIKKAKYAKEKRY